MQVTASSLVSTLPSVLPLRTATATVRPLGLENPPHSLN